MEPHNFARLGLVRFVRDSGVARTARVATLMAALALAAGIPNSPASAQGPLSPDQAPSPLAPWVTWVLDGQTAYGCTLVGSERQCVWPGQLALALGAAGGTFTLSVVADRETDVSLPGSDERFPRDVRVDGVARPIGVAAERPFVHVGPGAHTITGTLGWRALPEILEVPPTIARVSLVLAGERVRWPRREDDGSVWLARRAGGDAAEGHFEMEVFRRIEDGTPFRVTTHLAIRASGQPRELSIGHVLLEGMVPTELTSDLAVRLEPDGAVSAQVYAGSFTIEVTAVRAAPPETLVPPAQPEPWPEIETWTWAANEALRQVELDGAPSVDPTRTNLPEAWRGSPAYLLAPDRTLTFTTTRRGEPTPPPNALSLSRELWLDLDGEGYTVRDAISGQMTNDHRLDLAQGELGHVVVGGRDQLVTTLDGASGVELRSRNVDVRAEWRLPQAVSELPAVSWSEDVQSLSAQLRLPPGFGLLAVAGVDEAPGTWVELWNLWGLFFVVLLSLAIGKMFGWPWGALASVLLTLCYHEDGAPLWSWVFLLVIAALGTALTKGRLGAILRGAFWVAVAVLLVVAVPFAGEQLRVALYPQTQAPEVFTASYSDALTLSRDLEGPMGAAAPPMDVAPEAQALDELGYVESDRREQIAQEMPSAGEWLDNNAYESELAGRRGSGGETTRTRGGWTDPNDVIQTGPGVPEWAFREFSLQWSGPVARDHEMHLFLLTPWMNRLLSLLRVLLLGALLLVMIRRRYVRGANAERPPSPPAARVAAALVLASAVLFATPMRTHAQNDGEIPPDSVLNELRARLLRSPECAPNCVVAGALLVRIDGERVILDASVDASAQAAYRVPGPANAWVPESVSVDGRPENGLSKRGDGFIFLRLPPGAHTVRMEGLIPTRDSLTLAFGEPPRSIEIDADGWEVEGVRADGRVAESIQLRRTIRSTEGESIEQTPLTPWLQVSRRLDVGVRWTLTSTVERVTPTGTAAVVRIPLLPGESVTDADILTEGGEVVITLGRDDTSRSWTSVIEPRETISLASPEGVRFSERWTLACSPIWRCTAEGIAPVAHYQGDLWEPRFEPWPGDTLELSFARPEAAEGQSVTIDRATLRLRPGVRMLEATLETTIRASSGGAQELTLPEGARVRTLTVDGAARPVQMNGDKLRLTLSPGSQSIVVVWQQPTGLSAMFAAPKVELGAAAVNATVEITLPEDRWILWVDGPSWGAAVMFWPYLLLVLAIAWLLARSKKTPLAYYDWALLGLGLTQIPAWAALVPVGWFFAVAYRKKNPELAPAWFDLRQLALLFYTLVALIALYAAVHVGLLLDPQMEIFSPHGSGGHTLDWYQDRVEGTLPMPSVVSLPMWIWRVLMLAWALWLALRIIKWARWAWGSFGEGGLWKWPLSTTPARVAAPPSTTAAAPPPSDATPSAPTPSAPTPTEETAAPPPPSVEPSPTETATIEDAPPEAETPEPDDDNG